MHCSLRFISLITVLKQFLEYFIDKTFPDGSYRITNIMWYMYLKPKFIHRINDSPFCRCGTIENASHFFFDCQQNVQVYQGLLRDFSSPQEIFYSLSLRILTSKEPINKISYILKWQTFFYMHIVPSHVMLYLCLSASLSLCLSVCVWVCPCVCVMFCFVTVKFN